MADPDQMDDLEDGEIEDSDNDATEKVAPSIMAHRGQDVKSKKDGRMKVPGLSSEEDDSSDDDDDDVPTKRKFHQPGSNRFCGENFQNPLQAAKESGFTCEKNFWMDGAYESTKRPRPQESSSNVRGAAPPRKRINNIWGSVLQEEELTKGIGGLQNEEKHIDERGMGVESYDWRKSQTDNRPYIEPEEDTNDAEEEEEEVPDLAAKESFGYLKTKPRRIKERLGKRPSSDEEDIELAERQDSQSSNEGSRRESVKSRLGTSGGHRNSPVDPSMEEVKGSNLEHGKLHDRIRQHQSGSNGREDRRNVGEDRRNEMIQMNRKRRSEAKCKNQRDRGIQYVPMKKVEVKEDMSTERLADKLVDALGEPDDKHIIFTRMIKLCGAEKAIKLLRATEDVEEMGGLFIQNGNRRRTPGGVFFFLMKNDAAFSKEIMNEIFQEDREAWKNQCKERNKERKKEKRKIVNEHQKKLKQQMQGIDFQAELEAFKHLKKKEKGEKEERKDSDDMEEDSITKIGVSMDSEAVGANKKLLSEDSMERKMEESDVTTPADRMESIVYEDEDDLFDANAEAIELDFL